jgi:hypothetical protein
MYAEVRKKFQRLTRVFTGDEIGIADGIEGACTDVAQISDRSGDDEQSAHQEIPVDTSFVVTKIETVNATVSPIKGTSFSPLFVVVQSSLK